jgi:hypothetical protein
MNLKTLTTLPERLGESYWLLSLRVPTEKHERLAMTQKLNKNSDLCVTRVDKNYGGNPLPH